MRLRNILIYVGPIILVIIFGVCLALFRPPVSPVSNGDWGNFPALARTERISGEGRNVKLLRDFVYSDPRGKKWTAREGYVVDGASIPTPFWSLVGGPFEGKYVEASIVHDAECFRMCEPWRDVHKMFYEACRCGGVPESQAKILYWAVYCYGPRWNQVMEVKTIIGPDGKKKEVVTKTTVQGGVRIPPTDINIGKAAEYIKRKNPTLEEIESLDPDSL
jgi:Protein of unknown function (DUF1353)